MERICDGTASPTTQSNETVTSNVENTKEDVLRAIGPSKFTQLCMDIAPPEFWEALDVRSIPEERLKTCIGGVRVDVEEDDVDAFHREEDYDLRFPNKSLVIKDTIYVLMMDLMKKIPGFIDAHLLQAEGYYLHALYGDPLPDEPAQTVIHSPIGNREPSLEEEENGPLSSDASDDFNKSHTPIDLTIVSSPSLVGEPTAADKRTASDNKKAEDDKKKAEDDENNAEEKKRKRDEEKAQKQADADKEKAEKQAEKKRKREERQADAEKEKAEKQAEKKRKRDEEKAQKQADAEKEKAERQAEKKRKREEREAHAEEEKAAKKKEREEAKKEKLEARKKALAIAKGWVPESGQRREIFDCLLQEGGEVDIKKLQKHMIENYGYLNELAVMRVLTKEKNFDKPLWTGVIESNRYTKFTFTGHGKREVKRLQKDKGEEEEAADLEGDMDVEAKTPKTVPDPVLRFECYSLTDAGWRPSSVSMNAPWYKYGVDAYCKLVPATEKTPSEIIYRFNYGGGEKCMWFHTHCSKMMDNLMHSNINKWGYIKDRVPASFDAASQEDWGPPREDVLHAVMREPRR